MRRRTLRDEKGKQVEGTEIVVYREHAQSYDESEKEAELKAYGKGAATAILPDGFIIDAIEWLSTRPAAPR